MQAAHSSTLRLVLVLERPAADYVGDSEPPSRPQDPSPPRRRPGPWPKVDDAVREDGVEARVLEGELLDVSLDELDLRDPLVVAKPRGLAELLVGDIHPDHVARLAHQHRRAEDVRTRSRTRIEHPFAGLERGEVEVMPHSREGRQGLGGDRVQKVVGVPEVLGQTPPHLEVELGLLLAGHVAVHVLDLRLESLAVHERARIELRQGLRMGHLVPGRAGP